METHDRLEAWVTGRMVAPQPPPGWPDESVARSLLAQRAARRPRAVFWLSATAAAACAAFLLVPQSRAVAQRLWDQVRLGRLQVLVGNFEGIDVGRFSPEIQHRPETHPMPSVEEASRVAGFTPNLPATPAFSASPSYSVTDPTTATLPLQNGAVLEVRIGPVIIADFAGTLLLQSRPFQLITPAGFDLEAFYLVAFRAFGMGEQQARALSADLGISPALLTFMPKEDENLVHEFSTRTRTGVMINEVYGQGKTLALWSGSDRLYALFLPTRETTRQLVMEVADSLD